MIGLVLVLAYVALTCGFGDANLGTAVHNGADFLFYWYLVLSSIGGLILGGIALFGSGLTAVGQTASEKAVGAMLAVGFAFVALIVAFKTALLCGGCWLISLGVPVDSVPADWNWTKVGIGAVLVLFTLICLRAKNNNTETKSKD